MDEIYARGPVMQISRVFSPQELQYNSGKSDGEFQQRENIIVYSGKTSTLYSCCPHCHSLVRRNTKYVNGVDLDDQLTKYYSVRL